MPLYDDSERTIKDLAIELDNRPGTLAEMGEALGRASVSIEGGGAWVVDGRGIAHFLFAEQWSRENWSQPMGHHNEINVEPV